MHSAGAVQGAKEVYKGVTQGSFKDAAKGVGKTALFTTGAFLDTVLFPVSLAYRTFNAKKDIDKGVNVKQISIMKSIRNNKFIRGSRP